jgi:hypothetical protein
VYRHNEIMHGYQVRIGQRYVEVHGTPGVPHELLRQAALSLHPATRAELGGTEPTADHFAVTVPGYVGLPTGAPVGMSFRPANPAGNGPRSVVIRLYAQSAATDVCFGTTECTPDGDGLTYLRYEEEHGFTVRHGSIDVLVLGGLSTDRALLRQAVLDARPATDDQLRRALPPQRPGTGIERFRDWLRSL